MKALLDKLDAALKWLVILANGGMLLLVFAQVISRYGFGYTPSYGEELARYLFVWVVFLSLPLVARHGGHMCIETITSRVRGTTLRILNILADICSMAFLGIMVWQGILMVERTSFQTSPAMQIPMSWVYVVIPFGCGVMLLHVVGNFIGLLRAPAGDAKPEQEGRP